MTGADFISAVVVGAIIVAVNIAYWRARSGMTSDKRRALDEENRQRDRDW